MNIDLIKKCLLQDRVAQKQLYLGIVDHIYNMAFRYVKNVEDANDITQNTFVRIFTNLGKFQEEKGSFQSWYTKICVREFIAHKRLFQKIQTEEINLSNIQSLENFSIDDKLTVDHIKSVINQLNEIDQTILMMFYFDDLSHLEIAELLNIKESSSRSRLHRAKESFNYQWKLTNPII